MNGPRKHNVNGLSQCLTSGNCRMGGGMRDAKRRNLDVFVTDGQTLQTLFVNTSSSNFLLNKQSDQDSVDGVNTAATQATNGGMKRKYESESNPIVIS